jgi:hypothetical protein
MAKATFPIVRTRRTLPGASTAVRANIPTDTGAGLVGEAVASVGGAVSNLGAKYDLIQARSQLSESTVAASDIENAFFLELQGNNDPETYGESMEKLFADIDTLAPKNEKAAAMYNQQMAGRKLAIAKKTREGAQDKVISNAQSADFLLLQKAKETGDFIPYKASIINGVKLGVYTAKEGEALLDDADIETKKAERNAVLGLAMSQRDEDGVLDVKAADAEVDASDLSEDAKIDAKNQIENKANQEKKRSDEAFAARTGEETERLSQLLNDGFLIEQEIDEVDLGAVGDQKNAEKKWKDNWKADLRAINKLSEPVSSVENVYDELVVGSEAVERGALSPAEWETAFNKAWANGDLSKEDRRSLRSKDIVATKTMQNRAFSAETDSASEARFRLVEATEDQLKSFITARDLKIKAKDFTGADALTKALQKGQIQRWNMGRFRDTLRKQISQNPEWSQAQIFAASDILTNEFDKDFDVLVKDFDLANPREAITKNPPDDVFSDIWKDLSFDDKAKIWELRMAGATTGEILGELP